MASGANKSNEWQPVGDGDKTKTKTKITMMAHKRIQREAAKLKFEPASRESLSVDSARTGINLITMKPSRQRAMGAKFLVAPLRAALMLTLTLGHLTLDRQSTQAQGLQQHQTADAQVAGAAASTERKLATVPAAAATMQMFSTSTGSPPPTLPANQQQILQMLPAATQEEVGGRNNNDSHLAPAPAPQRPRALECTSGLLTFELSTGFIYKPTSALDTLSMMPSTLQLTDCLDYCLRNSSCLAINFEMGLCVLLATSAQQNPHNLYSSQFPVFTIYAEKKCLLSGELLRFSSFEKVARMEAIRTLKFSATT